MIYIDSEFKCYTTNADDRLEVITPENFVGMCDKAIECMRYVPAGMMYKKPDGAIIYGEFIQCLDDSSATAYQIQYEIMQEEFNILNKALTILLEGE